MARVSRQQGGLIALLAGLASVAGLAYTVIRDARLAPKPRAESDLRAAVVAEAMTQVGKANLDTYFAAVAPQYVGEHPQWCGIFALWALYTAGVAPADVKWKTGYGFLYRLPQTSNPKPGDVAYFEKLQHQALVKWVKDGQVGLINGNGAGGVVSESVAPLEKAKAYYSIRPWIDAALAREGK